FAARPRGRHETPIDACVPRWSRQWRESMSDLHDDVFAISPDVRYVASANGQQVQMRSRPDLRNASGSDSDRYEELLVNPTLLTLATQRGNIDCGGLRYLIVG